MSDRLHLEILRLVTHGLPKENVYERVVLNGETVLDYSKYVGPGLYGTGYEERAFIYLYPESSILSYWLYPFNTW